VPLAYALSAQLIGRRAGCIAAALTATTLPLVYWSQQVRGYTLAVALVLAAATSLVVAVRDGSRGAFVAFTCLAMMACYTELLAGIVIVIEFLVIGASPQLGRRWRPLVGSGTAALVGIVPLLVMSRSRGAKQLFWLGPPDRLVMRRTINLLTSSTVNGVSIRTSHALTAATVSLVVASIALGLSVSIFRHSLDPARTVLLGGLWLVVPIVATYVYSIHVTPIFLDRYLLICLPALTLLVSYLLSAFPWAPVGWLACALLIAARSQLIYLTYNIGIDDWRTATTMVLNESRSGDCVAFYFNDGFEDFAYYLEHLPGRVDAHVSIPRSVLPDRSFGADPAAESLEDYRPIIESYETLDAAQVGRVAATCPELFVISDHDGHNSASNGARTTWNNFIVMQSNLMHAYGSVGSVNLGAISIFSYSHR
jgi:hypothetical protein